MPSEGGPRLALQCCSSLEHDSSAVHESCNALLQWLLSHAGPEGVPNAAYDEVTVSSFVIFFHKLLDVWSRDAVAYTPALESASSCAGCMGHGRFRDAEKARWFLHDAVKVLTLEPFHAAPAEARLSAAAAVRALLRCDAALLSGASLDKADLLLHNFVVDAMLAAAERWVQTDQATLGKAALVTLQDVVLRLPSGAARHMLPGLSTRLVRLLLGSSSQARSVVAAAAFTAACVTALAMPADYCADGMQLAEDGADPEEFNVPWSQDWVAAVRPRLVPMVEAVLTHLQRDGAALAKCCAADCAFRLMAEPGSAAALDGSTEPLRALLRLCLDDWPQVRLLAEAHLQLLSTSGGPLHSVGVPPLPVAERSVALLLDCLDSAACLSGSPGSRAGAEPLLLQQQLTVSRAVCTVFGDCAVSQLCARPGSSQRLWAALEALLAVGGCCPPSPPSTPEPGILCRLLLLPRLPTPAASAACLSICQELGSAAARASAATLATIVDGPLRRMARDEAETEATWRRDFPAAAVLSATVLYGARANHSAAESAGVLDDALSAWGAALQRCTGGSGAAAQEEETITVSAFAATSLLLAGFEGALSQSRPLVPIVQRASASVAASSAPVASAANQLLTQLAHAEMLTSLHSRLALCAVREQMGNQQDVEAVTRLLGLLLAAKGTASGLDVFALEDVLRGVCTRLKGATAAAPQLPALLALAARTLAACARGAASLETATLSEAQLKRTADMLFAGASALAPFVAAPSHRTPALAALTTALAAVATMNRRFDTWQTALPSLIALVKALGSHLYAPSEPLDGPLQLRASLCAGEAIAAAFGRSISLDFGRSTAAALERACKAMPATLAYVEARP